MHFASCSLLRNRSSWTGYDFRLALGRRVACRHSIDPPVRPTTTCRAIRRTILSLRKLRWRHWHTSDRRRRSRRDSRTAFVARRADVNHARPRHASACLADRTALRLGRRLGFAFPGTLGGWHRAARAVRFFKKFLPRGIGFRMTRTRHQRRVAQRVQQVVHGTQLPQDAELLLPECAECLRHAACRLRLSHRTVASRALNSTCCSAESGQGRPRPGRSSNPANLRVEATDPILDCRRVAGGYRALSRALAILRALATFAACDVSAATQKIRLDDSQLPTVSPIAASTRLLPFGRIDCRRAKF